MVIDAVKFLAEIKKEYADSFTIAVSVCLPSVEVMIKIIHQHNTCIRMFCH